MWLGIRECIDFQKNSLWEFSKHVWILGMETSIIYVQRFYLQTKVAKISEISDVWFFPNYPLPLFDFVVFCLTSLMDPYW